MGMKCERDIDGGGMVTLGGYKESKYGGGPHQSDVQHLQHQPNQLAFFHRLPHMSFVLPKTPVHSAAPQYKFEVGGHPSHGTLTCGDSHTHPGSAVDPAQEYPTPAKVTLDSFLIIKTNLTVQAGCPSYVRPVIALHFTPSF